jgi:signal transduction histidine kinase
MSLIMIVDDEPDMVKVAELILKAEGYETIPAYSGEEALEKLEEVKPHLIIMDIMMPGIDGFETLKRIRENKGTSSIPVIIISVKNDESDIVRGLELGANDYFTKPYNRTILTAKVRSILRLKEMEDRLRRHSHELEQKVKERTRELEESNRLKDLFTDILSHDIMNPLHTIGMSLEILQEEELDPEVRERLKVMEECLENATKLVEEATTYARLENPAEMDFEKLDISFLLERLAEGLGPLSDARGCKISLRCPPRLTLTANPMVEEVFANLLTNAVKHNPEGTAIEMGVVEEEDACTIYVKDWGRGISEENRERLFNRFERLGREGVKGTGLGLAIAKRIVELHGGDIWVEDNPEGGSVFWVRLPKDVEKKKGGPS